MEIETTKKECPCYKCEERNERCHGSCEKYKEFLVFNKAKNEKIKIQKFADATYRSNAQEQRHINFLKYGKKEHSTKRKSY